MAAAKKVAAKAVKATPAGRAATVAGAAKKTAAKKTAAPAKKTTAAARTRGRAAPSGGGGQGTAPAASTPPTGSGPGGGTSLDRGRKRYGDAQGFVSRRLSGRGALLSEFLVCALLIGIGFFLSDDPKAQGTQAAIRLTGVCGVFLVLGLIAAAGQGGRKVATGIGLLVTLALLYNDRDVFHSLSTWTSDALSKTSTKTAAGTPKS